MQYSSIHMILQLLERTDYTKDDICAAINCLDAMYENKSVNEYQYKNIRKLLEDNLK